MALFVDAGTYLNYSCKPPGKAKAVLWPVLVHRVLYPEVSQPKMNLFQKVVMRLIRAKTHDAKDIALLTGLHINLVKLIQAQILSRGWINGNATELTETGLNVIHDEDMQSEQLASGYLFQDALTGKLWPRIDKRLAIIEPSNPGEERPIFTQNRKTGKTQKPFKPRFKKVSYTAPSMLDMLSAWHNYRSDYRAAQQLGYLSKPVKQVKLSGLSYQSEIPEPAWVLVWVTPSQNSKLWSIKDPFDIRDEAWWLADNLPSLMESNRSLVKNLGELIDQPEPDSQTVSEWLLSLQDQADFQVMLEYPWAKSDFDIASALAILIKRRQMIESGQDHNNDLQAAIIEAQKLLEVLMQWLIKAFPANMGSLPKQKSNNQANKQILLALELPAFTESVCTALSRQSLQGAIKSFHRPASSLKSLVFTAGLGAMGNENHPLKLLSKQQLQLEKLLELADLRNDAGHGNSRHTGKVYTVITIEIAQQYIEYALQFTEQFKEWINGEK
ncbi:hypothetical protein [Neptunomonas sp.]